MEALQATDRKLGIDERQEAWRRKKNPEILSIYAGQHPQCLSKSSELHYSPQLGREPWLGQPLQVGKVLSDNLYNNSVLCNQEMQKKEQSETPECSAHIRITQQTILQGQGEQRTALTTRPNQSRPK